jgi:hypothetical protein
MIVIRISAFFWVNVTTIFKAYDEGVGGLGASYSFMDLMLSESKAI